MAILGSGGHTAEMVRLLEGLNTAKFAPRVYVIARSDIGSQAKIEEFELAVRDKPSNLRRLEAQRLTKESQLRS